MRRTLAAALLASACLLAAGDVLVSKVQAAEDGITIKADTIGGVVKSTKGPEAGVWVIAETKDLPNRFVKIVVTDDQGR